MKLPTWVIAMVWEFIVGVFFKGDIFISNCNTTRGEIIDQK
jgi:hypothetical protein